MTNVCCRAEEASSRFVQIGNTRKPAPRSRRLVGLPDLSYRIHPETARSSQINGTLRPCAPLMTLEMKATILRMLGVLSATLGAGCVSSSPDTSTTHDRVGA